jgi:hypothetical protein
MNFINFYHNNYYKSDLFQFLMSGNIDLLAALEIQDEDVHVETYYSKQKQKHGFIISRREKDSYRMILNTEPIFETKETAKTKGDSFVEGVRKLDLSLQKSQLEDIMRRESTKTVSEG